MSEMSTLTQPHPNIDSLVAQLRDAADIADAFTHDDRDKLLTAARDLTIALETPVQSLMTIAKWVSSGYSVKPKSIL